jgi:hypothetical protein
MKVLLSVFFATLLFSAPLNAADTHQSLAEEAIKVIEKLTTELKDVKATSDFEICRAKFKPLTDEMAGIRRRTAELPRLEGDAKKTMEDKYRGKMDEVAKKLKAEFTRITNDVSGGKDFVKELSKMVVESKDKKKN